jgi:integrase
MTLTTGWSAPAAGEGADCHGEGGQPSTPPTASASDASNDLHGLTDSARHRLRFRPIGYTHATQLLNDGVPLHVVQRYLGHQRPEMTADTRPPSPPSPKRNSSNRLNQTPVARPSSLA